MQKLIASTKSFLLLALIFTLAISIFIEPVFANPQPAQDSKLVLFDRIRIVMPFCDYDKLVTSIMHKDGIVVCWSKIVFDESGQQELAPIDRAAWFHYPRHIDTIPLERYRKVCELLAQKKVMNIKSTGYCSPLTLISGSSIFFLRKGDKCSTFLQTDLDEFDADGQVFRMIISLLDWKRLEADAIAQSDEIARRIKELERIQDAARNAK